MRTNGAEFGVIDFFKDTWEGNQHVEHRTVSFDQHGIVGSRPLETW